MLPHPLLALTLFSALCAFMPRALAQSDNETPVEPKDVRAWLVRIHDAASRRNFEGTFVVSAGGAVSSARIAHFCEGKNQYERIDSLDGEPRQVFRHNDAVHTLWPQARVALIEQRDQLSSFPALLRDDDNRITEFYELRHQGSDRVAGHEASVLLLRPRDALRYGYRLWAEKVSGLLLRADVLGEHGRVLETSAFSAVDIGVRPRPVSVLRPMKKLDGFRVVRHAMIPTDLEPEGWTLRERVPGFRQVSCVKRPMEGAHEAGQQGAAAPTALQTIFSDGLTYVSVFIEPFDASRHAPATLAPIGATQTLMARHGDWWITVVGDVPAATLKAFAGALARKQ